MNIKGLAQALGLSIGTVSRALNDKPDVSEATRKRVLDAAVKLGYSANASGRSLRRGRTQTVAVVLETGHADVRGGDAFFMRIIDAMQDTLATHGYDLIILPSHSSSDPTAFLKRIMARGMADAIVITATLADDPRLKLLMSGHVPFLSFGRTQTTRDYAWVDLDFEGFLRSAMQALADLGHRDIAITVPPNNSNIAVILREAYAACCAQLGLPHDPDLVQVAEHSEYGGAAIVRTLLARPHPPTALVLNYEMMAFGAYSALRDAGLAPGRDLSLITLRRSRQLRFLEPVVAACDIDVAGLGRTLATETLRVIHAQHPSAAIRWPTPLALTPSVGPPRTDPLRIDPPRIDPHR